MQGKKLSIQISIKHIGIVLLLFSSPLLSVEKNQTKNPYTSTLPLGSSGIGLASSSWGNGLKILELATEIAPTPSAGGPQSVNSILNSIRIASSFLNANDTPTYISETSSSRPQNSVIPKINYSQQIGDLIFMGIVLSKGERYTDERRSVSSNGLYIQDRTKPALDELGFKIGIGPLNYLTDRFSFELSLKYSENSSNGPYDSFQLKFPVIQNSKSIRGYSVSTGELEFSTKNYSVNSGFAFEMAKWMNFYFLYDFSFFSGSLKLSSINQEISTTTTYTTTNNVLRVSESSSSTSEFTFFQTKKGLGNGLYGLNMNFETGIVLKLMNQIGIKLGGFYQLSFFSIEAIKGINYKTGERPIELNAVPDFTSSLTGKQYGSWGLSFAVVKSL